MKMKQKNMMQAVAGASARPSAPSASSAVQSVRPHSAFSVQRSAFTLVELLVAITIMAILAAMILFGLAAAEETGRYAKTQGTITKLHVLLMDKYESYRTRRLPVDLAQVALSKGYPVDPTSGKPTNASIARTRLDVVRELMRFEMPDRWTDIHDGPAGSGLSVPAVTQAYRRALRRSIGPSNPAQPLDPLPPLSNSLFDHQGAECLYLIVTLSLEDSDVLEQFRSNEIGDADGDGFLEFHDGWGQPISYLRWAPGFNSPLQPVADYMTNTVTGLQHDQFDPLRVGLPPPEGNPFRGPTPAPAGTGAGLHPPLFPLIYSGGPDRAQGIITDNDDPLTAFHYNSTTPPNNPYLEVIGTGPIFIGLIDPNNADASIDNITNHNIEAR